MDGWTSEWMDEFCDPAVTSAPSIDFGFLLHFCWIMWIVVSLLCSRVILLRGQKSEPALTSWPTVQDGWMDKWMNYVTQRPPVHHSLEAHYVSVVDEP
jgi:hypothetical protein